MPGRTSKATADLAVARARQADARDRLADRRPAQSQPRQPTTSRPLTSSRPTGRSRSSGPSTRASSHLAEPRRMRDPDHLRFRGKRALPCLRQVTFGGASPALRAAPRHEPQGLGRVHCSPLRAPSPGSSRAWRTRKPGGRSARSSRCKSQGTSGPRAATSVLLAESTLISLTCLRRPDFTLTHWASRRRGPQSLPIFPSSALMASVGCCSRRQSQQTPSSRCVTIRGSCRLTSLQQLRLYRIKSADVRLIRPTSSIWNCPPAALPLISPVTIVLSFAVPVTSTRA